MGGTASKIVARAETVAHMAGQGGQEEAARESVIDKLTEAQLDEFREAFVSFDKVTALLALPLLPTYSSALVGARAYRTAVGALMRKSSRN